MGMAGGQNEFRRFMDARRRISNGGTRWNREYSIVLHSMFYHFARIHETLRITPAMAAGVSDHVLWSIDEIIALLGDK
jgi:hypothetical protein